MKNLLKKSSTIFQNIWETKPKMVEQNDESITSPSNNHENRFVIEKGFPLPGAMVSNDDRQDLVLTLQRLKQGESFLIRRELVYPVAMIKAKKFREYKIRVRPSGELYRVFRVA